MLLDRNKYKESGYISEELFGDPEKERTHKCMVVEQTIADGDFSLDEALEAYVVGRDEYEQYIARKSNQNIIYSFTGHTTNFPVISTSFLSPMYIDVIAIMLNESYVETEQHYFEARSKKVTDELHEISREMKKIKEKV